MGKDERSDVDNSHETMIRLDHVSMVFNMASEQLNSLKEYFVALARRTLHFKEFRALDDISFEVKKGDVFGILGTNGSGKSTLLKIIAGVLEPTEGSCEVNGNIAPLIELGAGFDMELTARENIYLNGALLGYSKAFIDEHFNGIVSFAEIEEFLDMPMKNYSSGMVARIAFAIATVIVPEILIVDEVLSVGDFMFQQKCERRIDALIKEHQVTVLIVSHNNDQIERLCNKAAWIEKGHLRFVGEAHEICQIYRTLGGHVGSADSEMRVLEALRSSASVDEAVLSSFVAEDRYGAAVRFLDSYSDWIANGASRAVIAPGDDPRVCFIANSVAGALDSPLLMTRSDAVPDVVMQSLSQLRLSSVIIVGGSCYVARDVEICIRDSLTCDVARIDGEALSDIALNAYDYVLDSRGLWGDAAILTHPGCTAHHLSFEPYAYAEKVPVFFSCNGIVDKRTLQKLSSFKQILVVGDSEAFSDDFIGSLDGNGSLSLRFRENGAYNSNGRICEWIVGNSERLNFSNLFISSLWTPEDAYVIGPYAAQRSSVVLLEDPQDLDSVVHARDFISRHCKEICRLTFIGGKEKYTDLDKEIVGKALVEPSVVS